ncbi:MAG: ammonia-forming cytochrome c nitrite reductase subunit c552 [Ignavibacteriales bacterium]|nr:ammonia-forming cytochrome c nitrite reductase subunit c552 [Ignavibacteriales bacterium]
MKRFDFLSVITLFITVILMQYMAFAGDQCYRCHRANGDKPSALFKNDVHSAKGISCAGCHGGNSKTDDMEKAMDTNVGFIGVPKGDEISKTCAGCHSNQDKMRGFSSSLPTNQLDKLQTSVHGQSSVAGGEHIAQCITCHGAHGIVSVKNPVSPVYPLNVIKTCSQCHSNPNFMKTYNPSLPIDQLEKYMTSVHGMKNAKGDSKVAECASCHGSHDIRDAKDVKSKIYPVNLPGTCSKCHSDANYMKEYGIPTDQFDKFAKSVHGNALLKKHDVAAPACNDCHGNHGATPPGVESISNVCGTCHALNAELFSSSPHKKVFDENKLPECETCHSNHEIITASEQLLGTTSTAVCSRCHSENKNQKGFVVANTMRRLMDSLASSEKNASMLVNNAEQKGMEISEAKFKLRDVHQAWMQSRTMVHSFNTDKFGESASKGLLEASNISSEAQHAIDEYYFRRWGLGIATLIFSIVSITLYLIIKRIERKQENKEK